MAFVIANTDYSTQWAGILLHPTQAWSPVFSYHYLDHWLTATDCEYAPMEILKEWLQLSLFCTKFKINITYSAWYGKYFSLLISFINSFLKRISVILNGLSACFEVCFNFCKEKII
jgi:hypothetical protein